MGLKIEMNGKQLSYWNDATNEDVAAQIASDESEKVNAYVDDMLILGEDEFLAILVEN